MSRYIFKISGHTKNQEDLNLNGKNNHRSQYKMTEMLELFGKRL